MSNVIIDRELLKILFDLAVNSMDFGSGFFSTEDTQATRAVAKVLGLDPMVGTPSNHAQFYPHEYQPSRSTYLLASEATGRWPRCYHCSQEKERGCHK
jgi:hypothetical protein